MIIYLVYQIVRVNLGEIKPKIIKLVLIDEQSCQSKMC
jgi:hypothetical protein